MNVKKGFRSGAPLYNVTEVNLVKMFFFYSFQHNYGHFFFDVCQIFLLIYDEKFIVCYKILMPVL